MTITEIHLGVPYTYEAQQEMLDKGYTLQPHAHGVHRQRYVIAVRPGRSMVSTWHCLSAAVNVFGLEEQTIIAETKEPHIYMARIAGMWAARQLGHSSTRVGRQFNRDHSTVLTAAKRCEVLQAEDDRYRVQCERVMSMVRSA